MTRKLVLPLFALCALIAVGPASASAANAHASAKAQAAYSHKKQDRYIKKLRASVRGIGKAIALFTRHDKEDAAAIAKLQSDIATVLGAAPQLINGLTQLKDGLTKLGSAYQAVEYGVLHVKITAAGTTSDAPNQFSADIPDDGNAAQVSGAVPVPTPACGAPCGGGEAFIPGGVGMDVRASIRSAETDGQATGDPAGQVGGVYFVTCATAGGCGPTVGPGTPQSSVAPGTIMCTGTTPAENYSYLNPSSGNTSKLQLVPIQRSAARTDQSRPSDDPTDAFTVDATATNNCNFPGVSGRTYILNTTFQFFDLPTSTSPGATD
jgi:hypothetical protein